MNQAVQTDTSADSAMDGKKANFILSAIRQGLITIYFWYMYLS